MHQAFREYELVLKAPIGLEAQAFSAVLPHLAQRTQTNPVLWEYSEVRLLGWNVRNFVRSTRSGLSYSSADMAVA